MDAAWIPSGNSPPGVSGGSATTRSFGQASAQIGDSPQRARYSNVSSWNDGRLVGSSSSPRGTTTTMPCRARVNKTQWAFLRYRCLSAEPMRCQPLPRNDQGSQPPEATPTERLALHRQAAALVVN